VAMAAPVLALGLTRADRVARHSSVDETAAARTAVQSRSAGRSHSRRAHAGHRARSSIARAAPLVLRGRALVLSGRPLVVSANEGERVVPWPKRGAVERKPVRGNARGSDGSSSIVASKVCIQPARRAGRGRARPPASALAVRRAARARWQRLLGFAALGAPAEARLVARSRPSRSCSAGRTWWREERWRRARAGRA
jgi:hypothetical protein